MTQPDSLNHGEAGNIIAPECLYLPLPEQEDGSICVYWADRLLLITTSDEDDGYFQLRLSDDEKISRAKIIDFLVNYHPYIFVQFLL